MAMSKAEMKDIVSKKAASGKYSQYGLESTNATAADHDKGIVGDGSGSFYQIKNFDRQQEDGLDTDKGAAFGSGLKEAGAKAGFDPTTFNTATDVENALMAIGGGAAEERPAVKLSPRMQESTDLVEAARDFDLSGENTAMVYGVNPLDTDKFGDFAFNYKSRIQDLLTPIRPKTEEEVVQENADPNSIG
jgi:hypothetical protein